jgi:hypothetical protein
MKVKQVRIYFDDKSMTVAEFQKSVGLSVGGSLYLRGTGITALPDGLSVGGISKFPVLPNIDQQIIDPIRTAGNSLNMREWHTCETTHCRAGWAVHLAGEAGYALETATNAQTAGALIYLASRPGKPIPNWVASNREAMDDLYAGAKAYVAENEATSEI